MRTQTPHLSQLSLLVDVRTDVAELLFDLAHRVKVSRGVEGIAPEHEQLVQVLGHVAT